METIERRQTEAAVTEAIVELLQVVVKMLGVYIKEGTRKVRIQKRESS